jgi:hypothetical protein
MCDQSPLCRKSTPLVISRAFAVVFSWMRFRIRCPLLQVYVSPGCQVWATSSLTYDSSTNPCTQFSFWLHEKTRSWVSKKVCWYSLHAVAKQIRCPFFLLVQMLHTILEQFTLFKQSSSWECCAGSPSSCEQKWYMDLSDSTCTPRFPCVSAIIGCHMISRVYPPSKTVWAHFAQTYQGGLERAWQFDTTWDSAFQ